MRCVSEGAMPVGTASRMFHRYRARVREGALMSPINSYLDYSGRNDILSGGVREIPGNTPSGTYRVWIKWVGNNAALKLLLLPGGLGGPHQYLEACGMQGARSSRTRRPRSSPCRP
jgi:hypothetical protein